MKGTFHIALATNDLEAARKFYGGLLGCETGREAMTWVDYDFFGHQLTIQKVVVDTRKEEYITHPRTGMPLNHWGVILSNVDWLQMIDRLKEAEVKFTSEPHLFLEGEIGEQRVAMIKDPDGNVIEFKTFTNAGDVFRSE
ncbi:VOC family protein [Sanyastnella coralliicola]|uniref:VOC family protein n=1 Tax=Sanyastnella coralliicola TaxID=3069118 RepID=UPI0027B92B8E|nr:VOC family protein [Longitalea sp. SCSIO 12813]